MDKSRASTHELAILNRAASLRLTKQKELLAEQLARNLLNGAVVSKKDFRREVTRQGLKREYLAVGSLRNNDPAAIPFLGHF
jgi:hypothetical protein